MNVDLATVGISSNEEILTQAEFLLVVSNLASKINKIHDGHRSKLQFECTSLFSSSLKVRFNLLLNDNSAGVLSQLIATYASLPLDSSHSVRDLIMCVKLWKPAFLNISGHILTLLCIFYLQISGVIPSVQKLRLLARSRGVEENLIDGWDCSVLYWRRGQCIITSLKKGRG